VAATVPPVTTAPTAPTAPTTPTVDPSQNVSRSS
jgi:hypothetical protein